MRLRSDQKLGTMNLNIFRTIYKALNPKDKRLLYTVLYITLLFIYESRVYRTCTWLLI